MRSPLRTIGWPSLACGIALAAQAARAQSTVSATAVSASSSASSLPPSGPATPGLTAPRLRTPIEAALPDGVLAPGESASVGLELTIDSLGKVIDVSVVRSSGKPALDAAAVVTAPKLQFDPAKRDGKPIKAKIPYVFEFAAPIAPAASTSSSTSATPPSPKQTGIRGSVRTSDELPLPAARVTLTGADGAARVASTGADGSFVFLKLKPGSYKLRVEVDGFIALDQPVAVVADEVIEPVLSPRLAAVIEVDVKGERPREVVKRVLERRELARIPGTGGDALRAIQSLPGVARPPGILGLLIVRGSAPADTSVFIDGTLVPIAYHFGGLSSVVPTEIIEKIDFYPGNFSAEFGRAMGGIIDVGLKSPNKDKITGLLQFDLIDGRVVVDGPIDSKTRFIVAGRRSWIDAWLGPVLKSTGAGVSTAPRYYDYQVMIERDLTASTTARLTLYGSDDAFVITSPNPSDSDPAIGGDLSLGTVFWRVAARTDTRVSKDLRWINTLATGEDKFGFAAGTNLQFKLDSYPLSLRSDLRATLDKDTTLIVGLDWLSTWYSVYFKGPPATPQGQAAGPFFSRPASELTATGTIHRPGLYAMLDLRPTRAFTLLPGVRLDYSPTTTEWDVSPRLAARYDLRAGFPRSTLKGGIGVFHQPPQPQQSIPPFGTAGISNNRATHYDLGFEQEFTTQLELSVDGFYKDLQELVVGTFAQGTSSAGILYKNIGTGQVYGAEVLLKYKADDRFFGWISYTLSRSERKDGPGEPTHLFQYDQTHIVTVLGSYTIGSGWEVGLRFRYVSGSMYTPNLGGTVDFDGGAYTPVQSYPLYTARIPAFHQLDLRVDKKWQFKDWSFAIYLDLQNVYNQQNPEALQTNYNYNPAKNSWVSGIPILPNLGIRGEL